MTVVSSWDGASADALRQALRMTNESFAEHLGVAVRTVANWRKHSRWVPQSAMQQALDTALQQAPDNAKAQFALLLEQQNDGSHKKTSSLWLPNDPATDRRITPDDSGRIEAVGQRPSRLDAATVDSLSQVLTAQRHLDDVIGSSQVLLPAEAQMKTIYKMLREARGPHGDELVRVAADWTSFVGWLYTAVQDYSHASDLFKQAEELADNAGDGQIAATATSFLGYLALLQGRPRAAIRTSMASFATPGAHPTQQTYDLLQAAQAYADAGDVEESRRYLDKASDLATEAHNPPPQVYWYTEPFFRLNIGLAQLAIGDYREAQISLQSGLSELPEDQRNAEWGNEYVDALACAADRA